MLLTGCDKFEDYNTNPDKTTSVTPAMLTTKLILTIMQKGTYKNYINDAVLAKQMVWNENASELQYNLLDRKGFDNHLHLINCNDLKERAGENKSYEGLAIFTKAYLLYYSSIDLGDIPYSEAGRAEEGITKPKYDTQKDIMLAILSDLEEAYKCFAANHTFEGDPIFDGDPKKWMKTVTAFQLKVLINLSKRADDTADMNIKSRFASIVQNGSLMTENKDNFQLTYTTSSNMRYPFNDATSNQCKYAMHSSVLVDILKEYDDYRLFYFAEPAVGMTELGKEADDYDAYIGIDPSVPFGDITTARGASMFCAPNLRYTSNEHMEGEPLIRLGYGEQQLILAEACLRDWINGSAETYYKAGIKANMEFVRDVTPDEYAHGRVLTNDYISSYLNSAPIQLTNNFENDLKKIISQKYIASYIQYPYEAYYDYRRTGYPIIPINPETSMNVTAPNKVPVRYMYSSSELNYNRENLDEALQRQFGGKDDINEVMWILK